MQVVKLKAGVDVEYSFCNGRLFFVNVCLNNSIVWMVSCKRLGNGWRDRNVVSREKHFVLLCWRGGRWLRARWLVAGLATRMAGLACARAHRVTEGALRVRDTYDSL